MSTRRAKVEFNGFLETYKDFATQPVAMIGCVSNLSLRKAMTSFYFTAVSMVWLQFICFLISRACLPFIIKEKQHSHININTINLVLVL